jgi:hypothetical protein
MINYTPQLKDYMKALEDNRVFSCEDEHFIGFKYNDPTTYAQDWDKVTLQARGIAFDKVTGEIVARPFFKFFNYQELINAEGQKTNILNLCEQNGFHFNPAMKFRVMDKLDGSLGIIFWNQYDRKWQVKTGGSFNSDQAIWAQKWFDKNVNTNFMMKDHTYCVEILSDEDLHPISYDKEELVLLSVISNITGEEMSLSEIEHEADKMGIRTADVVEFDSFDDVIPYATNLPKDKEGVVVTFDNGFKVKLKGKEFLELQRAFHNLTEKTVWEQLAFVVNARIGSDEYAKDCQPYIDYIESIPEEMTDLHDYADHVLAEFFSRLIEVCNLAIQIVKSEKERKLQWEMANRICTNKDLLPAVMKAIGNLSKFDEGYEFHKFEIITPPVREVIYKSLKP